MVFPADERMRSNILTTRKATRQYWRLTLTFPPGSPRERRHQAAGWSGQRLEGF